MKCVILAAGASTRMGPAAKGLPKSLIALRGKPILQRTIELALLAGFREFGLVLGYRAEAVRSFVKEQFPFEKIRFLMNPRFDSTNNAFSLLMAREFFLSEEKRGAALRKLLLLDADIVFSPRLLPFLTDGSQANKVAVRVTGEHDEEEVRVRIDPTGLITGIGKGIPAGETYGESIGIEFFSPATARLLFEVLERRVRSGPGRTEFYEAAFQEMIDSGVKLSAVDVSDFPAAEIDTPEDLEFAEKSVVPKIDSEMPVMPREPFYPGLQS